MTSTEKVPPCPEDRQGHEVACPTRCSGEYADSIAESLEIIWQRIADRHSVVAANVMWHATRAMLDHESGKCRGITMQTWRRYVRMLLDDPDAPITILNRLYAKAHWQGVAA